jgi:NAD-dependent SIR2 family protein deacetylase
VGVHGTGSSPERDPTLAWGFYGHRLELYRKTVPHKGFSVLRKWAKAVPFGSWIFTSNVDGQFQRADFSENQIHECHGSIHYLQCMTDCSSGIWDANEFIPSVDMEKCRLVTPLPLCPVCGGLARPNIVMFSDNRWRGERRKAQIARQEVWLEKVSRRDGKVVIIEIGSGTAVQSVRDFSQKISREYNARIIRINPREWLTSSPKDVGIPCGSLEALTAIDQVLTQLTERQ